MAAALALTTVAVAEPAAAQGKSSQKKAEAKADDKDEKSGAEAGEGKGEKKTADPNKKDEIVEDVETKKGEDGMKTYTFKAIDVEGRLKSPQLLYFLRRVRAEFRAGDLGHRSFFRELSDTRRHPALR